MKKKELLRILGILKQAGFGYNGNPYAQIHVGNIYTKESLTLEELKSFEAGTEISLSDDELFEIYFIIHQVHDVEKNSEEAILYLLRAIKFKSFEESIRQRYLNIFFHFISTIKFQISDEIRVEIVKEFLRFKEYSKMTWGEESEIYKYSGRIIDALDCEQIETQKENLKDFIYRWLDINRRFRPDEQALDYASQLIFNKINQ